MVFGHTVVSSITADLNITDMADSLFQYCFISIYIYKNTGTVYDINKQALIIGLFLLFIKFVCCLFCFPKRNHK